MTSTRKRTVVRPLSVSSRMRAASSRCRGVVSTPRTPRARRFFWVGDAGCWSSMKVWAGWKPRFRSWRAASRRWQGLECSRRPCMTSMRKRTIRRPSSVSSRTMSAREGVVASGLLAWFVCVREHWFDDREVHSGVSRGWWHKGVRFQRRGRKGRGGFLGWGDPLLEKLRKTFLLGIRRGDWGGGGLTG